MDSLLEMRGITKFFPGVRANYEVNLSVLKGAVHALLGENGAGKTTLMNILYGLYEADAGEIFYDGHKASIHSPKDAIALGIGMVHQHFKLVVHQLRKLSYKRSSQRDKIDRGDKNGKALLCDIKRSGTKVSE